MDTSDKLLVLAYGITVYAQVVDNLDEIADLQVPVPHNLQRDARAQLIRLAQLWWADVHGDPVWRDAHLEQTVTEANAWVVGRLDRLTELKEGIQASGNN